MKAAVNMQTFNQIKEKKRLFLCLLFRGGGLALQCGLDVRTDLEKKYEQGRKVNVTRNYIFSIFPNSFSKSLFLPFSVTSENVQYNKSLVSWLQFSITYFRYKNVHFRLIWQILVKGQRRPSQLTSSYAQSYKGEEEEEAKWEGTTEERRGYYKGLAISLSLLFLA